MSHDVPVDTIVDTYMKIREAKNELTKKFKAESAVLEEQMDVLKYALLDLSKETGITSFSTPNATAYRTVKNNYWTNDWEGFYDFMQDNKAMGLLKKSIHQANMKEFMDQNPDLHPPGLNIDSEYEITIRRK
jgi:hypothetical protein